VLPCLRGVRSAWAAAPTPGGAGAQQSARVHDLLLAFEASLRALRPPGEHEGSL
jgi:hypothetical protein